MGHPDDNFNFEAAMTGFGAARGNNIFTPIHGPSSATNKVKKEFDFVLDSHRKIKREKKMDLGS